MCCANDSIWAEGWNIKRLCFKIIAAVLQVERVWDECWGRIWAAASLQFEERKLQQAAEFGTVVPWLEPSKRAQSTWDLTRRGLFARSFCSLKKRSRPGDKSFSCLLTSLQATCPTWILTCQNWFLSTVKSATRGGKTKKNNNKTKQKLKSGWWESDCLLGFHKQRKKEKHSSCRINEQTQVNPRFFLILQNKSTTLGPWRCAIVFARSPYVVCVEM